MRENSDEGTCTKRWLIKEQQSVDCDITDKQGTGQTAN